jgi:hypothetical protein
MHSTPRKAVLIGLVIALISSLSSHLSTPASQATPALHVLAEDGGSSGKPTGG